MKLVLLLWFLYFLQGIPYGFQTKFLPVFLRSYSLSLTLISLTRLLSLPWLLKPFWAPLIDNYGSKVLWVKYNLFGMAVCYLIASCMSLSSVLSTVLVVASLNIMAATQDIAVDSLFVSHLTTDEIGLGNIAQVVGYKTGSLFGGGCLGWLSSLYPWQWLFFLLFVMYLLSALLLCSSVFMNLMFPQIMKEKGKTLTGNRKTAIDRSTKHLQFYSNCTNTSETCKNVNKNGPGIVTDQVKNQEYLTMGLNTIKKRSNYQDTVQAHKTKSVSNRGNSGNFVQAKLKGYLNVYKSVLKVDGTKWTVVYVLIYKLGEQGMIAILPMFLLDQKLSSSDVAILTGVLCQFCSIFGSLIAGIIFYWDGLQNTLFIISTVRFMTACVLTWIGFFNSWIWFVVLDCLLHFVSGMITTLTFTLMVACSQKCPRILSATHYSTLATFEVFGKLCMASVSGTVVDMFGYTKFFVICTCLMLLPVILLRTGNVNFQQEKVEVKDQ